MLKMKCNLCDKEVWCLNNTSKGEVCYHCREKYSLLVKEFQTPRQEETDPKLLTQEQFYKLKKLGVQRPIEDSNLLTPIPTQTKLNNIGG